jgi:hypothetical protein
MQTSNSTPVDVRYTVETGGTRGPKAPCRTLLGVTLSESVTLPPYTYKVCSNGPSGTVHFYIEQKGEWIHVASGRFTDTNALVALVGRSGQYRVEVLYPQAA